MTEQPDMAELKAEIDSTRSELAETVDQLTNKLDVKAQASQKAHQAVETVTGTAQHAVETVTGTAQAAVDKVKQKLPDAAVDKIGQASGGVQRAATSEPVQQHRKQLLIGLGAVAALLLALLIGKRAKGS